MSKITNYRRGLVLERDNFTCHYCKIKASSVLKTPARKGADITTAKVDGQVFGMEVDHKIPIFAGGTNDLDNLVCACWRCNNKKVKRIMRNL